jgi:hypothetical protein
METKELNVCEERREKTRQKSNLRAKFPIICRE